MKIPAHATYNEVECDPQPGFYYVSIVSGHQFGLLTGPYPKHRQALDMVDRARQAAHAVNDAQASFAAFGTLRLEKDAGPGVLDKYGAIYP